MPTFTTRWDLASTAGTVDTVSAWDSSAQTGATTDNDMVWVTWTVVSTNDDTTATANGTTSGMTNWVVWSYWNALEGWRSYDNQPVVTADQVAAADEARRSQARIEAAKRAEATIRARALLLAMLTVQQRAQYQREQFFDVIARGSQRRYRIRHGTHGNVRLLDAAGREVTRYCAQPLAVPDEDAMLAQKLMLEHEEAAFLRVANATPLVRAG